MTARQARRCFPDDLFVAETQRTRGGKDAGGADTRPYRYGEFDLIAVSLYPSTGDWSTFTHTVADWLLPTPGDETRIFKFQPSSPQGDDWTTDFNEAARWLRDGRTKRIGGGPVV